ncbi:hypothetical protein [Microbacterium sp.]|jgi:hypothetical protein|uniref:hypothetical protein n=1 Tax=Microbacterium sp. TaxID=51671 RepID=UPI0037CC6632
MTVQTPPDPTTARPRRSGSALAVSILTIIVGGCVILGTLASSGFSAARNASAAEAGAPLQQSDTYGVRHLDVDVTGGALMIVYADVDEAELSGDGVGAWRLERRGSTLHVTTPRGSFADWGDGSEATLALPRALADRDVDVRGQLTGGTLDLDGDFGDVDVQVTGGSATLSGAVSALTLEVAGGSVSVDVDGARTAAFEVAGGELTASLTGAAPTRTSVEVTAGSADIALPDDTYRFTSEGPGSVDSSLRTSPTATPRVDVQATLGSVTLRTT